jgi:hypothetical protein
LLTVEISVVVRQGLVDGLGFFGGDVDFHQIILSLVAGRSVTREGSGERSLLTVVLYQTPGIFPRQRRSGPNALSSK